MCKCLRLACCLLLGVSASAFSETPQEQIENILMSLSLEEKAGQLSLIPIEGEPTEEQLQLIREGKVGSVIKANGVANNLALQKVAVEESHSGLPILFQEDVIHGYRTIAPVPLAEAASWDLQAIRNSAAVAAREARAAGIQLTYAPMVDVSRDPRWGRILEGAGEDPYLASLIAEARVRGLQESGEQHENILATVKHFAGYGASLAGRDYNIRDLSERELREIHLPPFKAAIDAGVSSVMGAYTAYDGVPATANTWLMQNVLRGELAFDGLLMTDWETIPNLIKIGVAADKDDAVQQAMAASFDMDMTSQHYVQRLPELVKAGLVSEKSLDDAVRRVLRLKQQAGLLDKPYAAFNAEREQSELLSERNWQETKDITLKSMVLLQNDNKVLPIDSSVKKIAVIGPMAKAQKDLLGWWAAKGQPDEVVSIYQGLAKRFKGQAELSYAEGVRFDGFNDAGVELIEPALAVAEAADMIVAVVGEQEWMSGEGGGTASLTLPGLQEELLAALKELGKPMVTVVVTGRPYVLTHVAKNTDALLQAWMPGSTGGEAVAEILAGDFNPVGRLPITFPYHQGQVPIFYNYKATSHSFNAGADDNRYSTTYRDVPTTPLYAFGFGLSYSEFTYGKPSLSASTMKRDSSLTLKVKVKNTGGAEARETVQLYLRDKVAEVTRPFKELIDFSLLTLKSGESQWVEFEVSEAKLAYIGRDLKPRIDAGKFTLLVGPNSQDLQELDFALED
ncbi:beta-glucosidase BglX [Agaribacterium sp. ZY112]|uniref:beta-glucosidase BglX n=1 Tax=Agaribacterium sp. ZY112 TaxID=3233574 RepID=UPI0035233BA8